MYSRKRMFLAFGLLFLMSCTGQSPAKIKNSTIPKRPVRAECNDLHFEGKVLTQNNIINILTCTGWKEVYPELYRGLHNANTSRLDKVLSVFNESFFVNREQRHKLNDWLVQTQKSGELTELSKFLERAIGDYKLIKQLTRLIETQTLSEKNRSALMKVVGPCNEENLKLISALKNILSEFEKQKKILTYLFENESSEEMRRKLIISLDEIAVQMGPEDWFHLAKILYDKESSIHKWATRGKSSSLRPLLDVLEEDNFSSDLRYFKRALDYGIQCKNSAAQGEFSVNVARELNHKIESLKSDSREDLEKTLLHGLTKFLAFTAFCEEGDQRDGLAAFNSVLKYAFNVIRSDHDYLFLRDIHLNFGKDHFKLISFLNSATFAELRDQLIKMKDSGKDEKLTQSLYELTSKMGLNDLRVTSELIMSFGLSGARSNQWFDAWSELWQGLSYEDKDSLIQLISIVVDKDLNLSKVASSFERLFKKFPQFSTRLSNRLDSIDFQSDVIYVLSLLSKENVQEELSRFLSEDGIFDFFEILTREGRRQSSTTHRPEADKPAFTYADAVISSSRPELTRTCFYELSSEYERNTDYYTLVNKLPDSCLRTLGNVGFVGQIYLWMNSSDKYFINRFGVEDFHAGSGVWSPGMLHFIFTAGLSADSILNNGSGRIGILPNLDEIHRVVTHPYVIDSIHYFSRVFSRINGTADLDLRIYDFFRSNTDRAISDTFQNVLTLLQGAPERIKFSIVPGMCKDIRSDLGADPCINTQEKLNRILSIARVLKRKNEAGNSLLQELVKWIHPEGGVPLPFKKSKTSIHKTSLDEISRFLLDLNSKKTLKKFVMTSKTGQISTSGTVIERLEVLIRDISFINNFYGAFFKNHVGSANDYRKTVESSEKLLSLMASSGGIFRGANTFPSDTKWQIKNVQETYSSLIELSDTYAQPDGSFRTYGPFIQSLLTAIGESSLHKTQSFNVYRVPDAKVVEGHNGVFLTELVNLSALRHLGEFIKSRFGEELSALNSRDFKQINNHLFGRHDVANVQKGFQRLMDSFLDNDRNQMNLLIADILNFSENLSPQEQELLEKITVKILLLLSDKRISNSTIESIAIVLEAVVESWPEIRKVLIHSGNKGSILVEINKSFDSILLYPKETESLFKSVQSAGLINKVEFKILISNHEFREDFSLLLRHIFSASAPISSLNWYETAKQVLGSNSHQWNPLKDWLSNASGKPINKLTLSLLIEFLGEKIGDQARFKQVMDELFLNHRQMLIQFLTETFPSLRVSKDSP